MKNSLLKAAALFLVIPLIACSGGGGGGSGSGNEENPERVQVFHAVATAGDFNIYSDGLLEAPALSFGETSSAFDAREATTEEPKTNFQVFNDKDTAPLIDKDLEVKASTNYTYYIFKTDTGIDAVLKDETSKEPAEGQFRVRFVNLAPSAAGIDVYYSKPGISLANAEPVAINLAYQAFSDYINVEAGEYVTKITTTAKKTALLRGDTSTVEAGKVITIAIIDKPRGGTPLRSKVIYETPVP